MEYIETPINPYRVGRTFTKMSNKPTTQPEVKAPKAKYSKTRGEHIKDVIIAMLVTGIIAFSAGIWFNEGKHKEIETAVKGAQTAAPVEAPVKK